MAPSSNTRGGAKQETLSSGVVRSTRSTRATTGKSKPTQAPAKATSPVKRKAPPPYDATRPSKLGNISRSAAKPPLKPRKRAKLAPPADDRPPPSPGGQRGKLRSAGAVPEIRPASPPRTRALAGTGRGSRTRRSVTPGTNGRPKQTTIPETGAKPKRSGSPIPSSRRAKRQKSVEEAPIADTILQASKFFVLPVEIHIKILLHVDITDLLTFRRTCRQADTLSRDRQLWSHAYRTLAQQLPPPPSPTAPDAMTSKDFERATCHMLKLDRNWKSTVPVPVRKKPLCYFASNVDVMVENMHLIPGGRWLLILTAESVTLWDVDSDVLNKPSATIQRFDEIYERSYMLVDVQDAPTASSLLIVSMYGPQSHVTLWRLSLRAKRPGIKRLYHVVAPFALQVSTIDRCISLRSDKLALLRWTSAQNCAVVIDWKASKPKRYVACSIASGDNIKPKSMQLLPGGRVFMLSDALLTIHAIPALSSAQDLDTLSPANADALWSLGLPHGPALDSIRNLWIFEDVPKKSGMEDVTCIVCAMAPAFRYIIRVPFSSTVPLDVNHASFGKPTVTSATDVNLYRGVVKIYETGLISFVGDLDNWIEVTHNVAKLQCFNSFDFPFMGGTEDADADVTLTTFDQGSGRVCVLNRFTNEIEAVDFA